MHSSNKSFLVLTENKEKILANWEAQAQKKVAAARQTDRLGLRDHLPSLLEAIAEILCNVEKVEDIHQIDKYQEMVVRSKLHGKHRATMRNYTVGQLIHEYIIFHEVLTDILEKHDMRQPNVINLLKFTIETAILESCASFSESIEEMQEQLVGTLAHDIRNPLTVALNSLALLNSGAEPQKEIHEIAIRSVKRALDLTENLLDTITVKAGEGIMMKFEEADYVKEVKAAYKEAASLYGDRIMLDCPDQEAIGIFDTAGLKRALENLISNAVKYGYVSTPIIIRFRDLGEDILIEVSNQGESIPQEKQELIFMFLTQGTMDNGSGLLRSWGIGLTLVKIVAEAHKGSISLTSEDENTTFSIKLKKMADTIGKTRIRLNYDPMKVS